MSSIARIVCRAMQCGVLIVCAVPLYAETSDAPSIGEPVSAGDEASRAITLAEVEAALAAVESDVQLDDAVKKLLRSKYQQAMETLRDGENFKSKAAEYRDAFRSAPDRAAEFRSELQALLAVPSVPDLLETDDPTELQREIDLQRGALNELNDELAKASREVSRMKGRPLKISASISEIERQVSEVRKQLSSPELAPNVTSPSRVAERIVLQARQAKLSSELEMLEQERQSLSVDEDLLIAQQQLLKRKVAIAASTLAALDKLLTESLTNTTTRLRSLAASLSEQVSPADEAANELAVEVQELASEFEKVVSELQSVTAAQNTVAEQRQAFDEEYAGVQEEFELSGGGVAMVQLLYRLKGRALSARADMITPGLPALDESRLASIRLKVEQQRQSELERQFTDHPSEAMRQLVATRRELLERLHQQYGNQIRALSALEGSKQQYLDKAEEVDRYVSGQLFGFEIRSVPPIHLDSLTEVPRGLIWLFGSEHWREFGSALVGLLQHHPVSSVGLLLFVTGLLLGRPRIERALEQSGVPCRRISTDRFSCTVQAIVWTLLLAAPIPILIGIVHWAIWHSPAPDDWMLGVQAGLWLAARVAFFAETAVAVCHPSGLGIAHFGWNEAFVGRLRRSIRSFILVYLPALVLTSSCAFGESSQYFESVGRISLLVAHVWAAVVMWRLVHGPDGVLAVLAGNQHMRRATRWRRLWFPLLLACPITLSIMACLGYLVTAEQLSIGLVWTTARIAGYVALYYVTLRWFVIRQRKLALAEAIERRRTRQEAADEHEQPAVADEIVSVDSADEQKIDLALVSEQVRSMLRWLFGLMAAIYVILFWTRVIPLVDSAESIPIPLIEGLSLLGLIKALLVVAFTGLTVRILPGLLELAVLRATTINSGTRHAIYRLGQYAVIAIGFSMAMNALHVDWAKLGWIVAGLSVGLGFGLQEVVANFVCGLILLFERPIRIGDIVTVEGTTGTVTRINIRATTITNWDRQEFVVPNKNLITGTILNWTLTASINRIAVPVGIAYGTDTEKALQILREVAADHPRVLDDPAPIVSFDEFGDSSLNLLLRAYLAEVDQRIATITELHTEIDKRFAAAGIKIPFPQRDVHLPPGVEVTPETIQTESAGGERTFDATPQARPANVPSYPPEVN